MNTAILESLMRDLALSWYQVVLSEGKTYLLPDNLDTLEVHNLRVVLLELLELVGSPQ